MKLKLSIIFLTIIFLFSCSKNNFTNEVNIRLSNVSTIRFENATFNDINFGDIDPGETSEYKTFESSYSHGRVNITIDGQDYGWVPIDFVGESLLLAGDYTFQYSFDTVNNLLSDKLIRD